MANSGVSAARLASTIKAQRQSDVETNPSVKGTSVNMPIEPAVEAIPSAKLRLSGGMARAIPPSTTA